MNFENLPRIDAEDKDAAQMVVKFLPEAPVILEAGACDAEDTIRFKSIWPNATIYCFEPNPNLFRIASRNIASPPAGFAVPENMDSVHIYNRALSDTAGKKTFYDSDFPATSSFFPTNFEDVVIPESILSSLKMKSKDDMIRYPERAITVEAVTIDGWRKEEGVGPIDYMWLDVEGAELLALKGAIETLKTVKVLYVEYSFQQFRKGWGLFNELYEFIVSQGFKIHVLWQCHDNWNGNAIFTKEVEA